jgi:hypothetical protein
MHVGRVKEVKRTTDDSSRFVCSSLVPLLTVVASREDRCCSCSCVPRDAERWRNEETDHLSNPRSRSDITDQLPPPCSIEPKEDGTRVADERTRSIMSHRPGGVAGVASAAAAEGAASAADALRWKVSWLVAFPWMWMSPLFGDEEEDSKHAGQTTVGALRAATDDDDVSTNSCGNSDVDDDEYYCWLHVAWPKALDCPGAPATATALDARPLPPRVDVAGPAKLVGQGHASPRSNEGDPRSISL